MTNNIGLENNLIISNSKLKIEWDYEKNKDLKIENIKIKSNKKVWWKCEKGHSWKTGVLHRSKGTDCPYCSNKKINEDNNLAVLSSKLAKEWNYERNNGLTPYMVALNYSKKIWWKCEKGHEWESSPNSRNSNKNNCPYCSGKYATPENNFAVLYPHLLEEWDFKKNKEINIYNILPKSHKNVWWKCKHGHEWDTPLSYRTANSNGCPYCSGTRASKDNNLAIKRMDLLKYWDYEKNKKVNPEDITPYSNKKVHWKCEQNHKWSTSPALFASCPYCKNRQADNTNSLEALYSELSKEWNYEKNYPIKPSDIVPGTAKRYWWKCGKCNHEWITPVRNRVKRGTGCPECSKYVGTSFAEQSVFFYLKKVFNDADNRFKYSVKNKSIEVDIFLPSINLGIEYDGYYYHNSNKKMKKDTEKNKLLENKINLIRIREKKLDLIDLYGAIVYQRTDDYAETLHEPIRFVFKHILNTFRAKLTQTQIESILNINIDINKDRIKILEMLNLQEIEDSVGVKHPHLIKYWDSEKNGTLNLYKLKETSKTIVSWKCNHGHGFKDNICNVVNRKNVCNICSSFGYNYPELLKLWDYDKNNDIDPFKVSKGSNVDIWWKCEERHSYNRTIIQQIKSKKCPYCTNQRVDITNCLSTTHPELAKQWHTEKNKSLTTDNVVVGSSKVVWWKCEHGHEWESQIGARIRNGKLTKCPYCINLYVSEENSIAKAVENKKLPDYLVKEWDYEKNNDLTPKNVASGSSKVVWWKCEHGHSWKAKINTRVKGHSSCPTCKSLGFLYPNLLKEWDYDKNENVNIYEIPANSKLKVWWKCENGHNFQSSIFNKINNKSKCLTCSSLGYKKPELLKEWDYEKNVGLDPMVIAYGNCDLKVWWKCKNGHSWQTTPYLRAMGHGSCIACNSLGFLNPTLAKELHPTKNGNLDAMTINIKSSKKLWWGCGKGHEWQATVHHRANGTGCPHCPQFKKVSDKNSLANKFPNIAKDWDYDKNDGYTPNDFTAFSSKEISWKCADCGYEWIAKIADRTRGYKRCKDCK